MFASQSVYVCKPQHLSPYITRHLKRYGDYVVDLRNITAIRGAIFLPIEIAES
jgi:hypothetical protein